LFLSSDPNGGDLPEWLQYRDHDKSYMDLNDDVTQQTNVFAERINLHRTIIPAMIKQKTRVITTPSGLIKGINIPIESENILQFRNIPYAKAPIGKLRFRTPMAFGGWKNILDATAFGPACIQDEGFGNMFSIGVPSQDTSEDCLSLNIYVPNTVDLSMKRSVMVWIHGGSYAIGQGSSYDGSWIALGGDVIVVTMNYRLGLFGFMSTEDAASPGNFGLWDQIMALKWVKQNIAAFGGDPESITIFGESAGSFCVSLQMMIPENKGLFHRAIGQSGTVPSILTFHDNPLRVTKEFGEMLNCTTESNDLDTDTFALIDCVRNSPLKDIQEAKRALLLNAMSSKKSYFNDDLFMPVIDDDLLKGRNPVNCLNDSKSDVYSFFHSIDLMAGTTNFEGQLFVFHFYTLQNEYMFNISEGLPTSVLLHEFTPVLAKKVYNDKNVAAKSLYDFYQRDDMIDQGKKMCDLIGDILFVAPTVHFLDLHSRQNSLSLTYQYLFAKAQHVDVLQKVPSWAREQSGNFEDILFLFGPDGLSNLHDAFKNESSKQLSNQMIKYWTNFAKKG